MNRLTPILRLTPEAASELQRQCAKPTELYKAMGVPAYYIVSHGADGKPFTKAQQVHMCGNRVTPPPMAALERANNPWRKTEQIREAA